MADVALRIEQSDGTTYELDAISTEWTESFKEQSRADIVVHRSDWRDIEDLIDERNDEFYVVVDGVDEFAGRYDDERSDATSVNIRLNSPEIDAANAPPTAGGLVYENVDPQVVVDDAINSIPTISAGTISLPTTTISYTISHGSQSKIFQDLQEQLGIEFQYNPDWSIDVVDRIGTDTGLTLSPATGDLGGEFNKTVDERDNISHLLMLGGEAGPYQQEVAIVPDTDTTDYSKYDNVETYTASNWSSGDRIDFDKYKNKESIKISRLTEIGLTLIDEYDGEPRSLDVETIVYGHDFDLGDRATISYTKENVDRQLRIVSVTTRVDTDGRVQKCTFSTRIVTRRDRDNERAKHTESFARGFGGFIDRDQVTSGWDGAGDGIAQTLEIPRWPDDIEREDIVELTIQGRPWRSPVSGAGHSHDVSVTHPSHSHSVSVNHPQHAHSVSVTHPSHSHGVSTTSSATSGGFVSEIVSPLVSASGDDVLSSDTMTTLASLDASPSLDYWPYYLLVSIGIANETTDVTYFDGYVHAPPKDTGFTYDLTDVIRLDGSDLDNFTSTIPFWFNPNSRYIEVNVAITEVTGSDVPISYDIRMFGGHPHEHDVSTTSSSELGTTTSETSSTELGTTSTDTSTNELGTSETATSDSVTAFQPGIVDSFGGTTYYPTDVDIVVNGTTITTLTGDSTANWQETIDLRNQLTPGSNTIEALPTGQRGQLNIHLYSELFRRGVSS